MPTATAMTIRRRKCAVRGGGAGGVAQPGRPPDQAGRRGIPGAYQPHQLRTLRSPGLREKLRCKEIWVEGADRYRNPDEDVPADFAQQREEYYTALNQPLDVEAFIARERQALSDALALLNAGMPRNPKVKIGERNGKGWIALSPLEPLPEPCQPGPLQCRGETALGLDQPAGHAERNRLRVHFTDLFQSATVHENLPRPVLQKRLLTACMLWGPTPA